MPDVSRYWVVLALEMAFGIFSGCGRGGGLAKTGLSNLDGVEINPFSDSKSLADVFIFIRTDCPISNRYAPEIERISAEFSSRRINFWLIYCDPLESAELIRRHMRDYGYNMNALRDPKHMFVRLTGVRVTPEVAVYSRQDGVPTLLYRGRIDDRNVDFGKTRPDAIHRDLREALSSILAGEAISRTTTPAVGCYISELR